MIYVQKNNEQKINTICSKKRKPLNYRLIVWEKFTSQKLYPILRSQRAVKTTLRKIDVNLRTRRNTRHTYTRCEASWSSFLNKNLKTSNLRCRRPLISIHQFINFGMFFNNNLTTQNTSTDNLRSTHSYRLCIYGSA